MLKKKIQNKIKEIINIFSDAKNFSKLIKESSKFVILISHSADSSGGAPVVLYEYAKYLKEKGKSVLFISDKRGSLLSEAKKYGIPSFESSFLYKLYLKRIKREQKNIGFIVVNTITLHKYVEYLSFLNYGGKILWWIHESKELIENYSECIETYNLKKIAICCVSGKVIENVKRNLKNKKQSLYLLPYGIKDRGYFEKNNFSKKFVITIIGRVSKRKNQIELIKAFKYLPSEIKNNIIIQIVAGSYDDDYLKMLEKVISNDKKIKIVGPYTRSEMKKVYKYSQIIASSSQDDPLPVVISEAMMYGRLIIVSSGNGQFSHIENGINGFKYILGNYKELAHIIEYIFLNFNKNDFVRKNARDLFLRDFSIDGMDNNVHEILEKM